MGFRVSGKAAGAVGAVVYGVPTTEEAQALAALAQAGKAVVVANPEALEVAPLSGLVSLRAAAAPTAAGPASPSPVPTIDGRPLQSQKRVMDDGLWAYDAGNVGKTQGWFTPEGGAGQVGGRVARFEAAGVETHGSVAFG